ncbi:MAG: 16S rRNA (guanine(966)-N(2))-methyltransferase RsmD [Chthoniobacterales bacterium]|nr:16S rRNA (guanine(966)-N(2))-methyltransferase RsmD [Chthoniobacterales bacterium]
MRIIAGTAKGRTLKTPASITRPTMDRVRAAIFSMLGDRVPNARVLDLFAGTGAMGIEALSRGADSVAFVDQDKKSTEVIRQNLELTKLRGEIKQVDAISFLKYQQACFDLIFADPPYASNADSDWIAKLLSTSELLNAIAEDGLLILECEKQQLLPELQHLEKIIDRTYGVTRIVIMRRKNLS